MSTTPCSWVLTWPPCTRVRVSQVLRLVEVGNGFKRTVSIQDVQAPPSVVWSRIMDLPKYPKMVEGCVSCVPYKREKRVGGTQVVYAKYKIRAAALAMEYFMKHTFEPGKNCMTFHLDYDRLSELFDTVGYWYVEKLSDGWCRVYYSTDSAVPAWVPGFMKDRHARFVAHPTISCLRTLRPVGRSELCPTAACVRSLVKLAAARSTSWVDVECQKEMGLVRSAATRRPEAARTAAVR